MKRILKEKLKKTFIVDLWIYYCKLKANYVKKHIIPSYDEKRSFLLKYKKNLNLQVFIETGTFLGDTIEMFKEDFEMLYSFELSEELANKAQKRFESNNHIKIIKGDSGKLLPELLENIQKPCLFWLDGHYSSEFFIGEDYIKTAKGEKETPILEELKAILSHSVKNHAILIDDARCFNGKNDYPSIKELRQFLRKYGVKAKQIKIKRDIIRITPIKATDEAN